MALGRGPIAVICLVVGMGIGFVARPAFKPTMTKSEKQAAAAAKRKKKAATSPATKPTSTKAAMRTKPPHRIDSGWMTLKDELVS